jgi:hypothetical protein
MYCFCEGKMAFEYFLLMKAMWNVDRYVKALPSSLLRRKKGERMKREEDEDGSGRGRTEKNPDGVTPKSSEGILNATPSVSVQNVSSQTPQTPSKSKDESGIATTREAPHTHPRSVSSSSVAAVPFVTPRRLKTVVAHTAPQFAGSQQHDAQELLTFLMDGIHEDVNRARGARCKDGGRALG